MTKASLSARIDLSELEVLLAAYLEQKIGSHVQINSIKGGPSGLSNATYFVEGVTARSNLSLVLRMEPTAFTLIPDGAFALQHEVPQALQSHGVRVGPVRWFEDGTAALGAPFLIMERVVGEVCSDRHPGVHGAGVFYDLEPSARHDLWTKTLSAMADLHQRGISALDDIPSFADMKRGADAFDQHLDRLEGWLGDDPTAPKVLREALAWLRENQPRTARTTTCWGDAKVGNVLYRDGEVAALLDWELAHVGAPELDLAYFILVDQVAAETHRVPRLDGLPSEAETVAIYEALSREPVQNYKYCRTFAAVRLASLLVLTDRACQQMGWNFFPPGFVENNPTTRILRNQFHP